MTCQHRVVVTGIGIVSSYGNTVDEFWNGVRNGRTAIKSWQPHDVDDFPVKYAATIDKQAFGRKFAPWVESHKNIERRGLFGVVAAHLAFKDARLKPDASPGVSTCSGAPEISDTDLAAMVGDSETEVIQNLRRHRHQLTNHSGIRCGNDSMAAAIARHLHADGPVLNVNGACAGAAQAIGLAFQCIRRGEKELMVAGGADSVLNLRTMSKLFLLKAPSTATRYGAALCRPFDKGRSGLVAGEGGAILVLEAQDAAKRRGADIYGEILGYGSSLDAYKITAPHPEGAGAHTAMAAALRDAKLPAEKIDYINAHGTSTPLNDAIETRAIKAVFPHALKTGLKISSTKSMIGHWIAAAGAPEAVVTLLAIKNSEIPPTINLDTAAKDCDLNYVAHQSQSARVDYAMSNSFGFGGINASLIFGRYSE